MVVANNSLDIRSGYCKSVQLGRCSKAERKV